MLALSMIVFMFAGCGGSADSSSSDSESENTELPNNTPDTYNIAAVLEGSWAVIDQEITAEATYSDDVSLNMYLVAASIVFSDTEITGTQGFSSVSIDETWRTTYDSDSFSNMEIIPINLDNQTMSMIKSGADNWRCEISDNYKTVMNIELLAKNLIQIKSRRVAFINSGMLSGMLLEYETTLTFRKKE